jgi:N-acetylneuraminate synthase
MPRSCHGAVTGTSVEPGGLERLVKYIRVTEQSLGDGVKRVYESELPSLRRLRRTKD